jgi:uncharacterized repeat protein (TIGR03803 family)
MTHKAGSNDLGMIFTFDPNAKTLNPLHNFAGGKTDGAYPLGRVILSGSDLYGVTEQGGQYSKGTLFKFSKASDKTEILRSFAGGANDGDTPFGDPIISGTTLYGTTVYGGAASGSGSGTVYMFDMKSKTLTLLHSFAGAPNDGANPYGSLSLLGTTLYAMTCKGGANDTGTIFSLPNVPLSKISGSVTLSDGASPLGVTMTLSQPGWSSRTRPDNSGGYSFKNLIPGKYTITPSLAGYAFTPESVTVSPTGTDVTENFTGTPVTISGKVIPYIGPDGKARGQSGITINFSGAASKVTDASGNYTSDSLPNGPYKVTPQPPAHNYPNAPLFLCLNLARGLST